MKTLNNQTKIMRCWCISSLVVVVLSLIWGCESTTSELRPVPLSDPDPIASTELNSSLSLIRSVTAEYQNVQKAEQAGFVIATPFVPYMGYHYVDVANVTDGKVDMMQPEALVYANNPVYDEKPGPPPLGNTLQLVAVEYLLPGTGEEDPSRLPDLFVGDEDQWLYSKADGVWTLHVWIWFSNPLGVFHSTNPLLGSGK